MLFYWCFINIEDNFPILVISEPSEPKPTDVDLKIR